MRLRLTTGMALALVVAGCADLRPGLRLSMSTDAHPAGTCPASDTVEIQLRREGDAAVFVAPGGEALAIVWPIGFAAWYVDGQTILSAPDGREIIREGPRTATIGGRAGGPGEPFRVCSVGERSYG